MYPRSVDVKNLELLFLYNKGIEYFTGLKKLICDQNKLTELYLTKNTKLTNLSCSHNKLTSLNLTQNTELIYLHCYSNQLTALDLTKNCKLYSKNVKADDKVSIKYCKK